MMLQTTCRNFECPKIEACTFNIWKQSPDHRMPCATPGKLAGDYKSQKQAIYKDYCRKERATGKDPMSPARYWEY